MNLALTYSVCPDYTEWNANQQLQCLYICQWCNEESWVDSDKFITSKQEQQWNNYNRYNDESLIADHTERQ